MVLDTHFYHGTIATYTAAIGSLFNEIKVKRKNGKVVRVPIAYASRQKFDVSQKYDDGDAHVWATWPRMAFQMTSMQRDSSRGLNKHHTIYNREQINETTTNVKKQLNRIPYQFTYELYVRSKNMDDLLQIVEQIAAWFNPSLKMIIKDNPDLDQETAINITLNSNSLDDSFQGMMDDEKTLSANLSFEVEGYLYMPTGDQGVIKTVHVNYNDLDPDYFLQTRTYNEDDAI